jgi:general secretion pathway protein G
MLVRRTTSSCAFSLVELVVVIVIIGILSAIAIPRMSRGAAGAGDSALTSNLAILRSALDLYQSDHNGTYPGVATVAGQLTMYTDDTGATSAARTAAFPYGPYLRAVPTLPVGAKKGLTKIAAVNAADVAWVYNAASGTIQAGASENDDSGRAYSGY